MKRIIPVLTFGLGFLFGWLMPKHFPRLRKEAQRITVKDSQDRTLTLTHLSNYRTEAQKYAEQYVFRIGNDNQVFLTIIEFDTGFRYEITRNSSSAYTVYFDNELAVTFPACEVETLTEGYFIIDRTS